MFRFEDPPSPFISMGSEPTSPLVRGLAAPPARAVTAHDVADEVLSGAWVVDVRASRRTPRTDAEPAEHVGWLRPVEDGFMLLADSPEELEDWLDLSA